MVTLQLRIQFVIHNGDLTQFTLIRMGRKRAMRGQQREGNRALQKCLSAAHYWAPRLSCLIPGKELNAVQIIGHLYKEDAPTHPLILSALWNRPRGRKETHHSRWRKGGRGQWIGLCERNRAQYELALRALFPVLGFIPPLPYIFVPRGRFGKQYRWEAGRSTLLDLTE